MAPEAANDNEPSASITDEDIAEARHRTIGKDIASRYPNTLDKLASEQEPLGEPFTSILHENLWDLYSRS